MILYHACYKSHSLIQESCTDFQKSRVDCMVIASAFTVPHFYISPRCRTRCSEQNYSNLNNRCWQQQHLPVSEGKNAANSTFWWWAERPTANMKMKAECYMKDVLDEKTSIQMSYFAYFLTQTFEKMHLLHRAKKKWVYMLKNNHLVFDYNNEKYLERWLLLNILKTWMFQKYIPATAYH